MTQIIKRELEKHSLKRLLSEVDSKKERLREIFGNLREKIDQKEQDLIEKT